MRISPGRPISDGCDTTTRVDLIGDDVVYLRALPPLGWDRR